MRERLPLLAALLLILIFGVLPVLYMTWKSLHGDISAYFDILTHRNTLLLLRNSLLISVMTSLLSGIVGIPAGILLGRFRVPFGNAIALLISIPLLLPPYANAIAWSNFLENNRWLTGFQGTVFVMFISFLPAVILLTMAYSRAVDSKLEEAALLHDDWKRTLLRITIPLMKEGLIFTIILVFLLSMGEMSIPLFMNFRAFSVETFIHFSAFYDFESATAYSTIMALVILTIILLEGRLLRKTEGATIFNNRFILIDTGNLRWLLFLILNLLAIVIAVVPYASLLLNALKIQSLDILVQSTGSLLRGILYASSGATIITILGLIAGYFISRGQEKYNQVIDGMLLYLFALPGTVIAIGSILLWNREWLAAIYSTPLVLIMGYTARYTFLTTRITASSLSMLPASMDEAAEIAGAGPLKRIIHILSPLIRREVFAGWIVAFIFCFRDLDTTLLLYPPGQDTLTVRIFTIMANGDPALISAMTLMLLTTVLMIIIFGAMGVKLIYDRWT